MREPPGRLHRPQPGPLGAAGAGEDLRGGDRGRDSSRHLRRGAVELHAVAGELQECLLERLLDVGEVVQRDPPRVGEVADLGRAAALDVRLGVVDAAYGEAAFLQPGASSVQVRRADAHLSTAEPGQDLGRRGVGDQPPAPDDDQPVGGLLHLAHQVARDQHGATLVGEPAQELADPADAVEVEPVDRLVEQQHPRVAEQRRRDAQSLAHARASSP